MTVYNKDLACCQDTVWLGQASQWSGMAACRWQTNQFHFAIVADNRQGKFVNGLTGKILRCDLDLWSDDLSIVYHTLSLETIILLIFIDKLLKVTMLWPRQEALLCILSIDHWPLWPWTLNSWPGDCKQHSFACRSTDVWSFTKISSMETKLWLGHILNLQNLQITLGLVYMYQNRDPASIGSLI